MDWTAGYASDVEYVAGFYREQSPHYINFACILNGIEPVHVDQEFNYFELGFGRGLTVNILAANYPQGRFYATDFNPAHVAGAQQIANEAQLNNLSLLEHSFEELALGNVPNLPQFDFITLHGVYSWVTAENRKNITQFIDRYLKPGGVVYVSYNAMPGWAAALPLQRLLIEYAELFPERSDIQVKKAAGFVDTLVNAGSLFFNANSGLKPRLETLKSASPQYLVHEYMHKHWQPLYHADVARDMQEAKLDYVGSADVLNAVPSMFIPAEKLALIHSVSDPVVQETIKDYLLNTSFRKDIYVRGARRISALKQQDLLLQLGLALTVAREEVTLTIKTGATDITGRAEQYGPVIDLLAESPVSMAELIEQLKEKPGIASNLAQIAVFLVASGQVGIFSVNKKFEQEAIAASKRLNRVLARNTRYSDDYRALASPSVNSGLSASFVARLAYHILLDQPQATESELAAQIREIMINQKIKMVKGGKELDWDNEGTNELREKIKHVMTKQLPLWQSLNVI